MSDNSMNFQAIHALVAKEQLACEQLIQKSLQSSVPLIQAIGHHITQSGGKRLRPLLVLLSAKAFAYEGENHIILAAIIELLHTATLLHDDVVDHAQLRRNNPTANHLWGDHTSVLVGDYLYSRAFQLIVSTQNLSAMDILAKSTNQMAEGEMLQLMNCHNPELSETEYMKVIHAKTGTLFAAAAQMGAVLTEQSSDIQQAMWHFGANLGTAFQLIDDKLDYTVEENRHIGKNMLNDLIEGKPTLPLIYALRYFDTSNDPVQTIKANQLRLAIREGKADNLTELTELIQSSNAIAETEQIAKAQAITAQRHLEHIPDSPYREGLFSLVKFAIDREH